MAEQPPRSRDEKAEEHDHVSHGDGIHIQEGPLASRQC